MRMRIRNKISKNIIEAISSQSNIGLALMAPIVLSCEAWAKRRGNSCDTPDVIPEPSPARVFGFTRETAREQTAITTAPTRIRKPLRCKCSNFLCVCIRAAALQQGLIGADTKTTPDSPLTGPGPLLLERKVRIAVRDEKRDAPIVLETSNSSISPSCAALVNRPHQPENIWHLVRYGW